MLKKAMAAAAVAVSVVGVSAAAAPQALALGDDGSTTSTSGVGAKQAYGNSTTAGYQSPQLGEERLGEAVAWAGERVGIVE